MIAAFSGFVAGRVAGLQEFGAGLALAVLLDATIVRVLLVPSLMAVLGSWNWWLPEPIARLARIRSSARVFFFFVAGVRIRHGAGDVPSGGVSSLAHTAGGRGVGESGEEEKSRVFLGTASPRGALLTSPP